MRLPHAPAGCRTCHAFPDLRLDRHTRPDGLGKGVTLVREKLTRILAFAAVLALPATAFAAGAAEIAACCGSCCGCCG